MNKVFNLLYDVDESIPIFEGFIAILCIVKEMVKVSEEVMAVFLKGPENGKNFHWKIKQFSPSGLPTHPDALCAPVHCHLT